MSDSEKQSYYTGYKRNLQTRWTVRWAERISKWLIALGGVGTVVCVLGVSLFLAIVVLPLFLDGDAQPTQNLKGEQLTGDLPLSFSTDEYRTQVWVMDQKGGVKVFDSDKGQLIKSIPVAQENELTSSSFSLSGKDAVLGYKDGTVRIAHFKFDSQFIRRENISAEFKDMEPNTIRADGESVVQCASNGHFRRQTFIMTLEEPIKISEAPVIRLDHLISEAGTKVVALDETGNLSLKFIIKTVNMFTDEAEYEIQDSKIEYKVPNLAEGVDKNPRYLFVSKLADRVIAIWEDGNCLRFSTQDFENPELAESIQLLNSSDKRVTAVTPLPGRGTLIVGDSKGGIGAWVNTKPLEAKTPDGIILAKAHEFELGYSPIVSFSPSSRNRLLAIANDQGAIKLLNVTNGNEALKVQIEGVAEPSKVVLAPKNDAILAFSSQGLHGWTIDPRHPEATFASLFLPVWYEDYDEPTHVWQSTGGDDEFEPKLGLWPLVFGTLKATFYTLLFGVPIALLAAIYTSEYLTNKWKARIKTLVELMASLPSVVLGFIGALVLAPVVQNSLATFLSLVITVPVAFALGGYAWQLMPERIGLRLEPMRLVFMMIAFPIGIAIAFIVGPILESLLFAGDSVLWLDGQIGSAFGGWLVLMLPISGLIVGLFYSRVIGPRFRQKALDWDARETSIRDLLRLGSACLITLAIACGVAGLLTLIGADCRGSSSVFDTYIQRNALIVGFVMGFAVIPIIYTIAEDALAAVPSHLRAASYGAGATPWQTAVRIVVPTAMSGLFSAIMIGLGRAVGETMIVLMAAGNTPILEMNLFNGFRTLSANIAVELPEAVPDSTHYRTLFLAAFILFLMTFVINTVAESVRIHFRKRSMQL